MDWSTFFRSLTHTDIAAYIGAVAGGAALLWNIYSTWAGGRVHLFVEVEEDYRVIGRGEVRYYIVAKISNIGKMPTSIHAVSLNVHTAKYAMYYSQFDTAAWFETVDVPMPYRLDSGASYIVETDVVEENFQIFPNSSRYYVAVKYSGARKPWLTLYKPTFFKTGGKLTPDVSRI